MRLRLRLLLPILITALFLTLSACDSEGSDGDIVDNGGAPGGASSLTATVDGDAFAAGTFVAARGEGSRNDEFVVIGRTEGRPVETIELTVPTVEGTHEIGSQPNAGGGYLISEPFSQFFTVIGGSGTITLTDVSDERLVGTFSFTAPRFTGSDPRSAVTVTGGAFNVRRTD
jgi:hypothetical protein